MFDWAVMGIQKVFQTPQSSGEGWLHGGTSAMLEGGRETPGRKRGALEQLPPDMANHNSPGGSLSAR